MTDVPVGSPDGFAHVGSTDRAGVFTALCGVVFRPRKRGRRAVAGDPACKACERALACRHADVFTSCVAPEEGP